MTGLDLSDLTKKLAACDHERQVTSWGQQLPCADPRCPESRGPGVWKLEVPDLASDQGWNKPFGRYEHFHRKTVASVVRGRVVAGYFWERV